jgi:hypothetical protein
MFCNWLAIAQSAVPEEIAYAHLPEGMKNRGIWG